MADIFLTKQTFEQIKLSIQDAIEDGDFDALREKIYVSFTEEQVEEIERHLNNGDLAKRLNSGDIYEFIMDILDEWSGDDVDELLNLFDARFWEIDIVLRIASEVIDETDEAFDDDDEAFDDDDEEWDDDDDIDDDTWKDEDQLERWLL